MPITDTRETSWRAIIGVVLAYSAATTLLNFAVGQPAVLAALTDIQRATGNIVQVPLLVSPFILAVLGVTIFGLGRLRCSDVGWRLSDVGPALLITLIFWAALQAALLLWISGSGRAIFLDPAWRDRGFGWFGGQLLAQVLGNALLEEMLFRGFLLTQLYLKASGRFREKSAVLLALAGSLIIFALSHIPHRLFVEDFQPHEWLPDQFMLVIQGLTYGALYLVTRNIFVCVGLHALYNQPARLFPEPFNPTVIGAWYTLVAILLLSWRIASSFRMNERERC